MRTMILAMLVAVVFFFAGCFSNNQLSLMPIDDGALYTKVVLSAEAPTKNRILMLDVDGIITEMGTHRLLQQSEPTTFRVRQKLDRALRDQDVKALIVRINSPGGGANASDIVYQEIMDYKAAAKVPVVAMMMGVAASGGYYTACAADRIVAHPNTVTGSIGVISFGLGFDGLFEKIGMESRVIKSGSMKDMGNPFDEWTDEEKQATQKILDKMYDRFVGIVAKSRNMKPELVREISDGRVMVASEAKSLGLVDRLGYIEDAVDEALTLAQIRDANVIMYVDKDRVNRNIYTETSSGQQGLPGLISVGDLSAEAILELARPRLMYLWMGY